MFQEDINLVRQIVAEEIAKALLQLLQPAAAIPAAPVPEEEKTAAKVAHKKP